MMAVISPSYITYICIEILGGTARGCGDSIIPMLLTCFGICVLRVIWILVIVPFRPEVSTVAFQLSADLDGNLGYVHRLLFERQLAEAQPGPCINKKRIRLPDPFFCSFVT